MTFDIRTTTKAEDVAEFIASAIGNQLKSGKSVLFFISGGSAIAAQVKVAKLLKDHDCKNLVVMLVDERYGDPDHADSNWHQLTEKGFSIPQAKMIPVLNGDDVDLTIENFKQNLAYEFNVAGYTIGLFGVGKDGHTAGILPESVAVDSEDLACGYKTPTYHRITITPKLIEELDEAVVFMQGEEKWGVLEDLKKNIKIAKMPVQILKKVPLLTIFTDNPSSRA